MLGQGAGGFTGPSSNLVIQAWIDSVGGGDHSTHYLAMCRDCGVAPEMVVLVVVVVVVVVVVDEEMVLSMEAVEVVVEEVVLVLVLEHDGDG
ncbi:unnamed protein product [Arctogadus glacialis]